MKAKESILKSLKWTTFGGLTVFAIRIFEAIVLARIVGPENFGIYASILVFVEIVGLVNLFSTSTIVVQDQERSNSFLFSNALTIQIALALLFLIIFIPGSSYFIENSKELSAGICLMALAKVFEIVASPYQAIMEKSFNFKIRTLVLTIAKIGSIFVALIFVFKGMLITSLFMKYFTERLLLLLLFKFKNEKIRIEKPNFEGIKFFLKKGSLLLLNTGAQKLKPQLDKVLIVKAFSPTDFGIYSKSVELIRLPGEVFFSLIRNVLFSYFSKIQNDDEKFPKAFRLSLNFLVLSLSLIAIYLYFLSPKVLPVVFGKEWSPMISGVQQGVLLTMLVPLNTFFRLVLLSKGFYGRSSQLSLLELLIMIVSVVVFMHKFGAEFIITSLVITGIIVNMLYVAALMIFLKLKIGYSNFIIIYSVVTGLLAANYFKLSINLVSVIPLGLASIIVLSIFFKKYRVLKSSKV